jgi:hypothetical protein
MLRISLVLPVAGIMMLIHTASLAILPAHAEQRELGLDVSDTTPASSFNNNLMVAQATGATYVTPGLSWNQIESTTPNDCTTPGNPTDP